MTLPLLLCGCSRAPSQNILGSFFPAWMLCAGIGILAAALCHRVLRLAGMGDALVAAPAVYLGVAVAVTLLVWLIRFGQ